jgi:ABC-type transport system involved in cytochrome c biogenesis permease subunit
LAELLFWPALLAYGEAAFAYFGEARRPGRAGGLATWGVRIGWLVQTALLAVQAARADGFPWSTWAGSLNLFVWLVVGAYLIWGSNLFLILHVGLVLAAFAGFTLAAGLSALYVWQERRLKRRESSILRLRVPGLAKLDDVSARTIAVALPALTLGVAVGVARLEDRGGSFDALMVVTLVTWVVYAAYLALRRFAGLRGRRAAYVVLAGFVLVAVVRLALPVTHFAT